MLRQPRETVGVDRMWDKDARNAHFGYALRHAPFRPAVTTSTADATAGRWTSASRALSYSAFISRRHLTPSLARSLEDPGAGILYVCAHRSTGGFLVHCFDCLEHRNVFRL